LNFSLHGSSQQCCFLNHSLIQYRQYPGKASAHRADIGVGWVIPGIRLAAAENLGIGVDLDVGFKTDYGFVCGHRNITR
jgi:hypothetical protein